MQANDDTSNHFSPWALVPVKGLGHAKQRLNSTLGPDRRDITLAMLEDVLRALARSNRIGRIAVVTADAEVASRAADHDVLVIDEVELDGMNAAINLGIGHIRRLGGRAVVVLPADLPLATGDELDRLLQSQEAEMRRGGNRVVGITASADGHGTNLLCLGTGGDFKIAYGPNSYSLHLERALQCGSRPVTLESPALALDIDRRPDLQAFIQLALSQPRYQATETWKFLHKSGLLESLGKAEGG